MHPCKNQIARYVAFRMSGIELTSRPSVHACPHAPTILGPYQNKWNSLIEPASRFLRSSRWDRGCGEWCRVTLPTWAIRRGPCHPYPGPPRKEHDYSKMRRRNLRKAGNRVGDDASFLHGGTACKTPGENPGAEMSTDLALYESNAPRSCSAVFSQWLDH